MQTRRTRARFIPSAMINVSCGPGFQLLTSVISPSPRQHKVNNKNSSNPGKAQRGGMSVLKENKGFTGAHMPARGPMWKLTVGRQNQPGVDKAGCGNKQTQNIREFEEVSSASNRRPEGNITPYSHGLVRYASHMCTNVF